jgi:hypothetical protein
MNNLWCARILQAEAFGKKSAAIKQFTFKQVPQNADAPQGGLL